MIAAERYEHLPYRHHMLLKTSLRGMSTELKN
jgi:hypothetical protein